MHLLEQRVNLNYKMIFFTKWQFLIYYLKLSTHASVSPSFQNFISLFFNIIRYEFYGNNLVIISVAQC